MHLQCAESDDNLFVGQTTLVLTLQKDLPIFINNYVKKAVNVHGLLYATSIFLFEVLRSFIVLNH